ncbi:MAG: cell surface protein SprA, partial [candidate division Zixibacteria bacterium]|nr:cell surface protein SprA [candidate division Zixibacteria bacterium]
MITTLHRKLLILAVAVALAILSACPALADGLFVAEFDDPPGAVSQYREPDYSFSAALYPLSFPLISQRMKRQPVLVRASSATSSLTFNTEFYKRGKNSQSLVPISADAQRFMNYRLDKSTREQFRRVTTRAITNPNRKKQDAGLGITVALPRRLDRVFGEGGAGLKVTGFRKITFSGRSNWTDAANSDTHRQSKFPSLNMEQVYQFDITGTIGSKISVKVSQNSQTDIPLANRIQLRYKGDEDDILKVIEAGNTNLSLPRTALVGYSARVNGLFGIKAAAQVGSLKMTAIASQEKGSADRIAITPGGEENATVIRDYEFAKGRVFDLGYPGEFEADDKIVNLIIYEEMRSAKDITEADGVAEFMVDPRDPSLYATEGQGGIYVKEVSSESYTWEDDPERNLHYVVFNSEKGRNLWLGAYIQVQKGNDTITIGDLTYGTTGDSLALRILRPHDPIPDYQSWKLMWRNCYNISRGVELEDLNLKVLKGLAGSELTTNVLDYQDVGGLTQNYIEILGLDQYNSANQKVPDGRVDDRPDIYRPDWGLIIFPNREPFRTRSTFFDVSGNETQFLQDTVPEIYVSTNTSSAQRDNSQYFLRISTKSRGSIIRLNRANIIEGSERVTANGKALTKGTDYTIDYSFGQINLISQEALDPNSELAVDFEYAPFLAIQKKTLLGLRSEYEYSKDFKFGTTVLYKSDKAQDRKPRVGQETAKALVYDLDASLTLRPSFITKMVDALPLVETESPSNFTISGEIAQSHPNPNIDGVAYVDDFESALDQLSLRTSRTSWTKSSQPVTLGDGWIRGQMLWHTPRDLVSVDDVWDREAAQGQGTVRTFRMIFRPRHVETEIIVDDQDQVLVDTVATGLSSWAGIMRSLPGGVDPKRAQLLEVRARAKSGKLHFDFGRISEDVNGNGFAESEDGITSGGAQNGAVEEDEDVGLDGLIDADESEIYDQIKHVYPDPAGDNWYFLDDGKCPIPNCDTIDWENEATRYEWLNGTEGNINDPSVQGRPDQEVLSSGLKTANSYFSFVLDFEADSFKVPESNWPPGVGEDRQWWTYRIPIQDSTALDTIVDASGMPRWEDVQHVRVWFEDDSMDDDSWDTVEVAAWYFVQSNWQDSVISPEEEPLTRFVVASVSTEDGTFSPPSGVEAYEDPTTNVTEAQRGLLLQFQNLNNIDTCLAVKEMIAVDQYSGYRGMEMFVYGDPSMGISPDIRFFFRIGSNAANFYEYRTFIDTGWSNGNHVKFNFDELTGFKDSLIRNSPKGQQQNIDDSNSVYRIKGKPNLNEVRYFAAGIVNTATSDTTLNGFVWLDELRVTGVRKDVGTAGRLSVSGSLADLLTYSFNFDSRDPFFRPISSATRGGGQNNLGSGKTTTSYRYSLTLQAHRFLPPSWGANIPIGYTYSKRTTTPLLRTGTDIVLPEEVRQLEQDLEESRSFTIRESFRHKGKNLLFDILLNRVSNNVTYGRKVSRRVTQPYGFNENFGVSSSLDMNIKGIPRPPILFWTKSIPVLKRFSETTIGIYPTNWKFSGNFNRNISVTDDPNDNRRSTYKRDFGGRMDLGYNLFDNLKSSFNLSTKRDLSDHDLVNVSLNDFRLGLETSFSQSFKSSFDPKLLSWFTTSFGYQAGYSDSWDRTIEARHTKMSRSWNVKGRFDHLGLFGGKSTGGERKFAGRRRTTPRGQKKDKDGEKEEEDKKTKGRPIYDYPLSLMRFLTGWIKPPTYSYGQSFNSSVPGTLERPLWRYRFGLERTTDVAVVNQSRSVSAGEGINYDASSGFSFLGGISCDVAFKRSI